MPQAINPYTFVPFYGDSMDEAPVRKPLDAYYPDCGALKSGWIDVDVLTRSELIIPEKDPYERIDTGKKKDGKILYHDKYHFFRHPDGMYAIPGSELRGMLRSMYEAASNSCFPFLLVDSKTPVSLRTPLYAAFHQRGLLRFDPKEKCFELYKAKPYRFNNIIAKDVRDGVFKQGDKSYTTGQQVRFSVDEDDCPMLGVGDLTGWLQFNIPVVKETRNPETGKSEDVPYHVAVLERKERLYQWPYDKDAKNPNEPKKPEDTDAYRSLYGSLYNTKSWKTERDRKTGVNRSIRLSTLNDLKKIVEDGIKSKRECVIPVYYFCVTRDGEPLYYISGAAAGRVTQKRKWADIAGMHSPCGTRELKEQLMRTEQGQMTEEQAEQRMKCLCPACALFGTVQGQGTKGRLRVTDARAEREDIQAKPHTLDILGGPKHSSFEFYLRKPDPDATYWNYDYYSTREKNDEGKERTVYHDLPEATPRGRKFYWHGERRSDYGRQTNLNATMDAIPENTRFSFRVYFDRITQQQLDDLLWLITLGENDEQGRRQYKLGHAKPLGYGSVKLVAKDCFVRKLTDHSMSLEPVKVPKEPSCGFTTGAKTLEAILRVSDSNARGGYPVEYLKGKDGMIFSWFGENRILNEKKPKPLTLPEPWEIDLSLPTMLDAKTQSKSAVPQFGVGRTGSGRQSPRTEKADTARPRDPASQPSAALPGQIVEGTIIRLWAKKGGVDVSLKGITEKGVFFRNENENFTIGQTLRFEIKGYNEQYGNYRVRPVR